MQIEFYIDPKVIKSVFQEKDNAHTLKLLNQFLDERDMEGNPNSRDLLDVIENHMRDDGGALDVDNLTINDITFNYVTGKGKIYVSFAYNRWFGCAGISDNDIDEDDFKIFIDKNSSKIYFEYYIPPVRESDTF